MNSKNKKGSAYILVITGVISVFFMFSLLMYITNNETKTTKSLIENDSMYYIALSGIEKTEEMINKYINVDLNEIKKNTLNEIKSAEIYYKGVDFTKSYIGEFTFKEDNLYKNTFKKLAKEKLVSSLNNNFNLEYTITYNNGVDGNYNVKVKTESSGDILKVTSTVKNLDNNNVFKLEGKIEYLFNDSEEIIIEKIKPLKNSEVFNYPYYANEKVFLNGKEVQQNEFSSEVNSLLDNMFLLNINSYEIENPLVIIHGSEEIDISDFYSTDMKNIVTYIINKDSNSHTTIRSSDLNKNVFNGIIISKGDVFIDESIIINGTIISEKNIYINGMVEPSQNIFDILITDKVLRRKVSDFFGLTNFIDVGGKDKVNISDFPNAEIETIGVLVKDIGKFKVIT